METDRGCVDINECLTHTTPCHLNEFCVNNEGSHSCLGKYNLYNLRFLMCYVDVNHTNQYKNMHKTFMLRIYIYWVLLLHH